VSLFLFLFLILFSVFLFFVSNSNSNSNFVLAVKAYLEQTRDQHDASISLFIYYLNP
jgi:Ni,Fe-hydrogenase I cytochrome b subunit